MNNIIVFGGAGRTGREVVLQALAAGHKVSVFTRAEPSQDTLPPHNNLSLYIGDASNLKDVTAAIKDHDVVINIIAPRLFDKKHYPISEIATNNIISAMQALWVKRYIGQAGAWATEQLSDASPIMQLGFKIFLPLRQVYSYKKKEDAIVKNSGLDWTLVRCGVLTNTAQASKYRIFKKRYKCGLFEIPKIRRTNVANFELTILNDAAYYKTCPIIIE
jgi:nucleoside-diphosphate-sugar epimerase